MNFYKRHLGDVAKSCSDLSQGQMGAYDLLLDWHYANEKPLPLAADKLYLIGRARTKPERDNVDSVLAELFNRTLIGYTHKRAAEEMAKANAQADTNRRIAEEREARRRERNEHDSLHGSYTDRQPSQTPDSRLHSSTASEASTQNSQGATAAGLACRAMREAGCALSNPSHPDLLAALAEGVTAEALADTTREAIAAGKTRPFGWAIQTARSRHAEGARAVTTGPPRVVAPSRQHGALANLLGASHAASQPDPAVVLDVDPRGSGEPLHPVPRRLSSG